MSDIVHRSIGAREKEREEAEMNKETIAKKIKRVGLRYSVLPGGYQYDQLFVWGFSVVLFVEVTLYTTVLIVRLALG